MWLHPSAGMCGFLNSSWTFGVWVMPTAPKDVPQGSQVLPLSLLSSTSRADQTSMSSGLETSSGRRGPLIHEGCAPGEVRLGDEKRHLEPGNPQISELAEPTVCRTRHHCSSLTRLSECPLPGGEVVTTCEPPPPRTAGMQVLLGTELKSASPRASLRTWSAWGAKLGRWTATGGEETET